MTVDADRQRVITVDPDEDWIAIERKLRPAWCDPDQTDLTREGEVFWTREWPNGWRFTQLCDVAAEVTVLVDPISVHPPLVACDGDGAVWLTPARARQFIEGLLCDAPLILAALDEAVGGGTQ